MSRRLNPRPHHPGRFPRVSGDEPALAELLHHEVEFSPRERG